MTKVDIARKYRDERGSEMPTKTLAKIIFKENPAHFKSVEDARSSLRHIEGKQGKSRRIKITHPAPPRSLSPYKLPAPDSEDLLPYRLPSNWTDFIFASDFHIPNHRTEPIERMVKYAQDNNIRKIILGGDVLDNTPFTRWMREPLKTGDVKRWFDMAIEFLKYIKSNFDEVIWIEGNHDFWYKRYLMQKAEELFGDSYYDLESRLQLNQIGVKFIPQNYLVKAGKLNIHHGHITFRGGGSYANAARMLYMKTKSNMLCGHVHVESSHTEPDINDEICTTFTVGSMCTLRPEYQPFGGKSCHGFARIKIKQNKNFSVMNFRIYKGEIM